MIFPNWRQLDDTIARLSDADKRRLIERIEQTLGGDREPGDAADDAGVVEQQKAAWTRLRVDLAGVWVDEPEPAEGAVSEHYRRMLYGDGGSREHEA